jgi:flagellar biosynthesis chaperone FliJ
MAQGRITPVGLMTSKMSKLEKQVRTQMEAEVNYTTPKKPKPTVTLTKEERKLFNRFVKLNDSFTEADSTSLSLLTTALYRYEQIKEALSTMDIFDERNITMERRMLAYDKAISQHMTALSIPLTQRLRMSNDLAKVMIEEKKLEQMNGQAMPEVNPALAILDRRKR